MVEPTHKGMQGVNPFRHQPFNLKGGGGGIMVFCFVQNFFLDNTRVRIFFPEFNIRLYVKNSESDYFVFPPPKSEYFYQQHWESEYFFGKKNITPPPPPPPPFKLNGRSLSIL